MTYANFNIIDWHAISAGLDSKNAWLEWRENNFTWLKMKKRQSIKYQRWLEEE